MIFAVWMQMGGSALGGFGGLPLLVIFMVAMYVFLVLPSQRKQKKWQEMLGALKSGDQVTTNGGIRGVIVSMKEDALVLRVQPDGVKLEIAKSAIAAVTTTES